MRSLRALRYCTLQRSPKVSKDCKKTLKLVIPIAPTSFTHLRSEPRTSDSKQAWIRHQSYLQVRQCNARWIFGCATIWRSPALHSSLTPNQGPNFKPFLVQYSLAKQISEIHFVHVFTSFVIHLSIYLPQDYSRAIGRRRRRRRRR